LVLLLSGCKNAEVKATKENTFYVGTYTDKDSKGIYKYSILKEGKLKSLGLMASLKNRSFLTK
jgi:6-phosphogluconolactonase